jgi:hypothetical protein
VPRLFANIATGQVAVAEAAIVLVAANDARSAVTLTNTGAATVFIGKATVTAATGHALAAGASITLRTSAALYGISASGTNTVTYCEETT